MKPWVLTAGKGGMPGQGKKGGRFNQITNFSDILIFFEDFVFCFGL